MWIKYNALLVLTLELTIDRLCHIQIYNNNNLTLRLWPSHRPNWSMRPPCLWDKESLPPNDLIVMDHFLQPMWVITFCMT